MDFSEEAYPTDEEIKKIEEWPTPDFHALFEFIKFRWEHYGRWTRKGNTYRLATGGWSGNEEIITAMRKNFLLWSMCWELSRRGGLFIFRIPKVLVK